jgi:hypothetical protein
MTVYAKLLQNRLVLITDQIQVNDPDNPQWVQFDYSEMQPQIGDYYDFYTNTFSSVSASRKKYSSPFQATSMDDSTLQYQTRVIGKPNVT